MTLDGLIKALHQVDKIAYRPAIVYKIARGYFRTLVLRKPTLRIIEFSITAACQSTCEYCYASKFGKPGGSQLSLEEIKSVWAEAKSLGAFCVQILGGEPTLHPQFLDIVKSFEPKSNIVTMVTNSLLLDEKMVLALKETGVFLVYISLNSLDAETNDKIRGYEGHLAAALKAIEICKKHGLKVSIPVTTSRELLPETEKILAYARENDLQSTINLLAPVGRAEGQHEQTLDVDFWHQLRKLYMSNPGLRGDWDVNQNLRIGCPSGYEKIHISPYGEVTGCSLQPVSFGNVREEKLEVIIKRMQGFDHYAKRAPNCIVALDEDYIRDFVDYAENYDVVPYDVRENPLYEAHSGRTGTENI